VLEAARSQIAGTISQTEVKNLPLNGRNFLDLALLVPGVSPPNVGGTQLFAETSAGGRRRISVGSQRNFSNNFIVDGLSANDDAAWTERHSPTAWMRWISFRSSPPAGRPNWAARWAATSTS
jgi:hypothetical protein